MTVGDLDATISKAESLGASVLVPISDLPDGGRIAVLNDPQGGSFGLAQYAHGPGDH